MKTIKIDKPITIRFVNENSETTAEIVNPHPSFVIPRIGENFDLASANSRTNVVTDIHHDFFIPEVIIFYDFFDCFENNQIILNPRTEKHRIPKENLK